MSSQSDVRVRYSQLSKSSIKNKPQVHDKLQDFLNAKVADPIQPYGKADTRFVSAGPIGQTGLKLRHAHLTQDVSVVYKLHGDNPKLLDVYGVFTHKELGTSNTSNIKTQKKIAKKFAQQDF